MYTRNEHLRPTQASDFWSLLLTQALTPFHHNFLRSTMLTMVAFGGLPLGGFSPEIVIGLSTLFLVAPYVIISVPAGRLADRIPKARIIRYAKTAEILIATLGGLGLLLSNTPLLLLSILLAGTQAAIMGPAKFAILPELLEPRGMVAGNAWITASSTLAVLLGLILGNLLALNPDSRLVAAAVCVGVAILGWMLSLRIPSLQPSPVEIDHQSSWLDLLHVLRDTRLAIAILACSWFWFQGVFFTTILPLFVATLPTHSEQLVSILLLASTLGVTLGALAAKLLEDRFTANWVPTAIGLTIALPAVDIGLAGGDSQRLMLDFFVSSLGMGLFAVPMGMALQTLGPPNARGRSIGANHMANGLAMMVAGVGTAALGVVNIGPTGGIIIVGIATGLVALLTLGNTLPIIHAVLRKPAN
jgi:MFS family permease